MLKQLNRFVVALVLAWPFAAAAQNQAADPPASKPVIQDVAVSMQQIDAVVEILVQEGWATDLQSPHSDGVYYVTRRIVYEPAHEVEILTLSHNIRGTTTQGAGIQDLFVDEALQESESQFEVNNSGCFRIELEVRDQPDKEPLGVYRHRLPLIPKIALHTYEAVDPENSDDIIVQAHPLRDVSTWMQHVRSGAAWSDYIVSLERFDGRRERRRAATREAMLGDFLSREHASVIGMANASLLFGDPIVKVSDNKAQVSVGKLSEAFVRHLPASDQLLLATNEFGYFTLGDKGRSLTLYGGKGTVRISLR